MWFTEAYIENIFNKVIFKTFILKSAEKKCPNILPRPGSSRQDSLFSPEQVAATSDLSRKKINGEEDEKI